MDVHLLELFLRVAEHGSINKAAAQLHMSQPSLSRHVASLEHEMGTPLFTRTQAGVHLTEAGRLLADRARPLLRQFSILKEQVGERAAGQLAVGVPPAWRTVFTSPFVEQMVARHPGLALRVYEGVSNVLREYMYSGLLDLSIVPFSATPPAGYRQRALAREPLVLVGRGEDGLRADKPVPIAALDDLPLVLPSRPNTLRVQIEHALQRKTLRLRLVAETDALALHLDLVRRGVGHSVMPASALYEAPGLGDQISAAPIKGQFVAWALCENEARAHSQAVREGHKLVIGTVHAALKNGDWAGAEDLSKKA